MKISRLLVPTIALLALGSAHGQIFSEDFGSLVNGTVITTSNTDFTYVRTSTGTGATDPNVINPATVGSGSSGFFRGPSGSSSLTGVGVADSLTASNVYTFSVDFRFSDVSSGDIVFGVGSGDRFTGNSGFSTSQGLFWLQSDAGNFERRTSSAWEDVNGGTTFSNSTNYSLHVVANGSAGALNYGSQTVAAGAIDIYLNGILIDDDAAVTTSLTADGFRIYSVQGTGIEIDNVTLWNSAQAVPEPNTYALLSGVCALAFVMLRRRSVK